MSTSLYSDVKSAFQCKVCHKTLGATRFSTGQFNVRDRTGGKMMTCKSCVASLGRQQKGTEAKSAADGTAFSSFSVDLDAAIAAFSSLPSEDAASLGESSTQQGTADPLPPPTVVATNQGAAEAGNHDNAGEDLEAGANEFTSAFTFDSDAAGQEAVPPTTSQQQQFTVDFFGDSAFFAAATASRVAADAHEDDDDNAEEDLEALANEFTSAFTSDSDAAGQEDVPQQQPQQQQQFTFDFGNAAASSVDNSMVQAGAGALELWAKSQSSLLLQEMGVHSSDLSSLMDAIPSEALGAPVVCRSVRSLVVTSVAQQSKLVVADSGMERVALCALRDCGFEHAWNDIFPLGAAAQTHQDQVMSMLMHLCLLKAIKHPLFHNNSMRPLVNLVLEYTSAAATGVSTSSLCGSSWARLERITEEDHDFRLPVECVWVLSRPGHHQWEFLALSLTSPHMQVSQFKLNFENAPWSHPHDPSGDSAAPLLGSPCLYGDELYCLLNYAGPTNDIQVYSIYTRELLRTISGLRSAQQICVTSGELFLLHSRGDAISVWSCEKGNFLRKWRVGQSNCMCLCTSSSGEDIHIVTVEERNGLTDRDRATVLARYTKHGHPIASQFIGNGIYVTSVTEHSPGSVLVKVDRRTELRPLHVIRLAEPSDMTLL